MGILQGPPEATRHCQGVGEGEGLLRLREQCVHPGTQNLHGVHAGRVGEVKGAGLPQAMCGKLEPQELTLCFYDPPGNVVRERPY
ncbi:hypothetical protein MLD38_004645 [Melastoma candidum]|uniref:Uncharacterized protein n=1 Tax=Melastoma candidum TaxID=119954 RepID=A0ACB9S7U8_9MYRT|nr:hypothetical protein MLD38_004645 [Melastoma candidum]